MKVPYLKISWITHIVLKLNFFKKKLRSYDTYMNTYIMICLPLQQITILSQINKGLLR